MRSSLLSGLIVLLFFLTADSPITRLTCLTASNISFNDEMLEPVDLVHIGQLKELQELKLKSNSGNLIIDDFSQSLQEFVSFKPNMTNLVKE